MRKLLPYEYQLIETLGITKEEYLEFVAIQQEYKDPKAGTALDVRAADPGTQALVLTIVGVLFQVGAALLAPKPEIPSLSDRRRRNREQRFAPTFGFNSTQELASYGDPVNLVYTNQNKLGDVRVAGSLVWSAVDNFGSTQFMRLLLVIGAGKIQKITYGKTAFGQTSLRDLDPQNVFIFEDEDLDSTENQGPPPFKALSGKFADKELFPTNLHPRTADQPAFLIPTWSNTYKHGYSQAYTPTTSTSLGVFDAIPINVDVKTRDKDGDREEANIAIEMKRVTGTENYKWFNYDGGPGVPEFDVGKEIQLFFNNAGHKAKDEGRKPAKQADNLRRQVLESLDFGSSYMLGSAKFRLKSISSPRSIDRGEVNARFVCVEKGRIPSTLYKTQDPTGDTVELRRGFEKAKRILGADNDDFNGAGIKDYSIPASQIVPGDTYVIKSIGDGFDFTTIGAPENTQYKYFVADSTPTDASDANTVGNASVLGVDLNYGAGVIKFEGTQEVTWEPKYVASVSKNFNLNNRQFTDALVPEDRTHVKRAISRFAKRTKLINRYGSIKYTRSLLEDHLADKPVLKTSQLKKEIGEQIEKLNTLIGKIAKSKHFDGTKGRVLQCNNDFVNGFNTNNGAEIGHQVIKWDRNYANNIKNLVTRKAEGWIDGRSDQAGRGLDYKNRYYGDVVSGNHYYFTFLYIDSTGRYHLFNFNGIQTQAESDVFPNDATLNNRRNNLGEAERQFYKSKNANRSLAGLNNQVIIKTTAVEGGASDPSGRTVLNKRTGVKNESFNTNNARAKATAKNALVEKINKRIEKLFREKYEEAIEIIKKDKDLLKQLKSEIITSEEETIDKEETKTGETDRAGTKAIKRAYRKLIEEKKSALGFIKEALGDWDGFSKSFDNSFFTKCLVKADTASYSTLSECNMVNFSFKTRLFRRISGRQKRYGDDKMREYSETDNGVKSRMVFFRMSYQEYKDTDTGFGGLITLPYLCAIRHGSESDFYTQLSFYVDKKNKSKWKFTFTPVYDVMAEYRERAFDKGYILLENSDNQIAVPINTKNGVYISWYGRLVAFNQFKSFYPNEEERGPIYTNEWDMFSVNSDTQTQFSFESGPEIQLTAVTEQQFDFTGNRITQKYKNMSMMGVGVFAGRGLQDLRSITALVNGGKLCRTVASIGTDVAPTASSSYAPDIFVDTLLDKENGLGKYLTDANLDKESLTLAKAFCVHNNLPGGVRLYMDGLIADASSWREFWIANAPFSLLELARKNGKDTLVPALPVEAGGKAAEDSGLPVGVNISALFTTGNILEGSYKEEFLNYEASTEDLIASVIYREYTTKEIFSQNRSVEVKLRDTNSSAVRETFDLSQFVTQREQAIMFGKLLCNQRRYIKQGVEFQTIPSQATVEPGDFIYVDVGLKKWDGYSSGVIMPDTTLNAPLMGAQPNGVRAYNFLVYNKTNGSTSRFENINVETVDKVSKAPSLADYVGWMFVMGLDKPSKRVYRVTEIALEEEGEVSIKAIEYPCFEESGDNGNQTRARIADFRASNFKVS